MTIGDEPQNAFSTTGADPADAAAAEAEGRLVAGARALARGASTASGGVPRPFGRRFFAEAAAAAGLAPAEAALLAPGGPRDLVSLLFARHDDDAFEALKDVDPAALKIRERIFVSALARVEAAAADADLVRQASLFLARPPQMGLGVALGWRSADRLWRWAGDRAADENHYSKRVILSGLLLATLSARLSGGREAAERRLRAGIDGVMRFETFKGRLPSPEAAVLAAAGRLGALRFRARPGEERGAGSAG